MREPGPGWQGSQGHLLDPREELLEGEGLGGGPGGPQDVALKQGPKKIKRELGR